MPETKRCVSCVVPATVPGSGLDRASECTWCSRGEPAYRPKGPEALRQFLQENRRDGAPADCLVGISGGKDSSYAVLELTRTFGMRVEAFTYTHAGLTPFALENARRVCRELGVPHHLVSLNGDAHLSSFRSYFEAWLESPNVIAANMTCVACKHLHLLGTRLAARRGIPIVVWSQTALEAPPFLALPVDHGGDGLVPRRASAFSAAARLARQLIASPALTRAFLRHFVTSIIGCLSVAPTSRFIRWQHPSVRPLYFYDFIAWHPAKIRGELERSVGWQKPPIGIDDWHSDCLFGPLKEYMFQTMFGASYTDAYISNQIRNGILERDGAQAALLKSKQHFAKALPGVLAALDYADLLPRIDASCFDGQPSRT